MSVRTQAVVAGPQWPRQPRESDLGRRRPRFDPILDIAAGTTGGYQAVPALLTAADAVHGVVLRERAELSVPAAAALFAATLRASATRTPDTFVLVSVGVGTAAASPLRAVAHECGAMTGVIVDVVGALGGAAGSTFDAALAEYRALGARLAVGGHGTPQPELTSIKRLKPYVIRLGRDWVRGIEHSPAKRGAIEVIGRLCGELDARVLAEGVTNAAELRVLADLQVPLASGPYISAAASPASRHEA